MAQQGKDRPTRIQLYQRIPKLLITAICVLVVLLILLVSFRVKHFEVVGNDHYSVEDIANASGITEGDILMAINKTAVAGRLLTKLPFLEEIVIHKTLPNTIRFEVKECNASAICESEYYSYWLLSDAGRLLEEIDSSALENYRLPVFIGTTLVLPTTGATATYTDPDRGQLLTDILNAVLACKLTSHISSIDVSNPAQVTLLYDNALTLQLGNGSDAAYKLQYFLGVFDQLPAGAEGILDLSFTDSLTEQAIFHPYG